MSPEIFERQMRILAKRWEPIPLLELVSRLEQGTPIPRRSVVVTFDDGTEDTFTHAFPILQSHRIPATVFLISNHIDHPAALKRDQIDRMKGQGISFGSHTLSHAYLPSLSEEEATRQIVESKRNLERLGIPAQLLSYPAGGFTPAVREAVIQAGYRGACTTNRGMRRFPIDRWALRRISMRGSVTTPFSIWVRCSGFYGLNRRLRSPS